VVIDTESQTVPVVFWDFDGTLARRDGLWSGAILDALRRIDPMITTTVADLKPHLAAGFPWHRPDVTIEPVGPEVWWARLRPVIMAACTAAKVPVGTAAAAADLVPEEFYRFDAWQLIDGADTALARTRAAGYRNVILSNHAPELPELVGRLGLAEYVDLTITSAEIGAEKPNPVIFRYAIKVARACVAQSWMIGDNPVADIRGAQQVGLSAILADGVYPDAIGVTVLQAAQQVVSRDRRLRW
jgi:putative hydrolase of the HAD superfamily